MMPYIALPLAVGIGIFSIFISILIVLMKLFPPTKRKYKLRKRIPRNEFVFREGRMDLTGAGWILDLKTKGMELSDISASSLQGWYNFMILQAIFYLIATFFKNYSETGSLIRGHVLMSSIIAGLPAIALYALGIWIYSFIAWGIQVIIIKVPKFKKPITFLQHCLHVLVLVFTWYVCYRNVEWPWSQKFALQVHSWVCHMKMHSYLLTNDELRANALRKSYVSDSDFIDPETSSRQELDNWLRLQGVFISQNANITALRKAASFLCKLKIYRQDCWPKNVNFWDFFFFTFMPVLCYEPLYPRTSRIRWWYLIEKAVLGFSMLSMMWTLITFIQPILVEEGSEIYTMIRLNVPMSFLIPTGFIMVFDVVLCFMAEVTYYGDRCFYEDWWNSCTFKEFSRKWNKPVYEFLHRHIYTTAVDKIGMPQQTAVFGTFFYSIVIHEFILTGTFHKVRPYLTFFSLMQIPLYSLMDVSLFRRNRFGNLVVLGSFIISFPMISIMYAKDYCDGIDCSVD